MSTRHSQKNTDENVTDKSTRQIRAQSSASNPEIEITELEKKLISSDNYDYKYIFDVLERLEETYNNSTRGDIIQKKTESVKILVSSDLSLKFGSVNMISNNYFPNCNLSSIDKFLGVSFRTRLVKVFIDNNVCIVPKEGNLTEQLIHHIGSFLDIIQNSAIEKFPQDWNVQYFMFNSFRTQLKSQIQKYLTSANARANTNGVTDETNSILSNIKMVAKFETGIADILTAANSNIQLNLEDSLINCFENSLLWYINNIKTEIESFVRDKNTEVMQTIYTIPPKGEQRESYKIEADLSSKTVIKSFVDILDKCNKYSTGRNYSMLIKEVLTQVKNFSDTFTGKYTAERNKIGKYTLDTEFILFSVICNIDFLVDSISTIQSACTKRIQTKYIPTTEFNVASDYLTQVLVFNIDTWVNETCGVFNSAYDHISSVKFEKITQSNISVKQIIEKQLNDYSTTIVKRYKLAIDRCHRYVPEHWANFMAEKVTYSLIDLVISNLLKLRGVHSSTGKYFDVIVSALFQITNDLLDQKLLPENSMLIYDDIVGSNGVATPAATKSCISTRITQIRVIINAISVEAAQYDESKHAIIFGENLDVSYNTMILVKGNVTINNFHKMIPGTIEEKMSIVTDPIKSNIGETTGVIGGGINNMAERLTRLVTGGEGLSSSNHGNVIQPSTPIVKSTLPQPSRQPSSSQSEMSDPFGGFLNGTKKMFGSINIGSSFGNINQSTSTSTPASNISSKKDTKGSSPDSKIKMEAKNK